MRWVVRILSVVAVMVGLAFATLALIPSDRIAALAANEFSRLTGRELQIEGAGEPSIWPVLGVRTGRVTLGNAPWSDQGAMLTAEGLGIGVDLSDLLAGSLRITELSLIRPDILLERAEDGQANWHFAPAGTARSGAATPLVIEAASIEDGRIRYVDHASGRTLQLLGVAAFASMPDPAGSGEVELSAKANGQSVDLSVTLTGPGGLFAGDVVPVRVEAGIGAARLDFDGRAGLSPLAAEGKVEADLSDVTALATAVGLEPPSLPEGWGSKSVTVAGQLTVTATGSVHLRGGEVGLDDRRLTGDADFLPGTARPRLVAQLSTGAVEFSRSTEPAGTSGWPDAAIDTSALGQMDADIGFRATSLAIGPLRLGAVNGQLTLDRGRAILTLAEVAAYEGAMSGRLVADARDGLAVAADLGLKGVSLQPLLADVAGVSRVRTKGDLSLDVAGSGRSVAAIIGNLAGTARFSLGKGNIEGLDLAGLLATLDPVRAGSGGVTAFDSLTGTFRIERGEALTEDLALRGDLVRAKGTGRIGLASRDLDLQLQTRALTGADGTGGLGVPVLVAGPWDAPRIGLDLAALAAERVDKAARDAAERKLGLKAGETIEDAAKRKLDAEIQRSIDKTLEGLFGN